MLASLSDSVTSSCVSASPVCVCLCVCVCVCVWFEPRRVLLTEGGREGEKERRVCGGDIETDDDTERDENVTQLVRVDLAYIYIYIYIYIYLSIYI